MSGEIAALTAAIIWAFTSTLFARVGRTAGPLAVNAFKTILAALFFTVVIGVRVAGGWDPGIRATDAALLAVSGIAGLTIGDSLLFKAFVELGARRATLVFSVCPVMGAIGGALFFDERLGARAILGMVLTLGGIAWVVLERPEGNDAEAGNGRGGFSRERVRRHLTGGVFAALGAAFGQAVGALIAKPALAGVDSLPATWVRMTGGGLGLLAMGLLSGRLGAWRGSIFTPEFLPRLAAATVMGPFFGVWCMFYALGHTQTGVALTLLASTPIWLLALNVAWHRERVNAREIVGIIAAMAGIAVLMLRPS